MESMRHQRRNFKDLAEPTVSKKLRRWTRNPSDSPRKGSDFVLYEHVSTGMAHEEIRGKHVEGSWGHQILWLRLRQNCVAAGQKHVAAGDYVPCQRVGDPKHC